MLLAASVPWWGAPLFTLAGALGAASLGQVLSARQDAKRLTVSHALELRDRRIASCVRLLGVIDDICYSVWWKLPRTFKLQQVYEAWSEVELTCEREVGDPGLRMVQAYAGFKHQYEKDGLDLASVEGGTFPELKNARWAFMITVKRTYELEGLNEIALKRKNE